MSLSSLGRVLAVALLVPRGVIAASTADPACVTTASPGSLAKRASPLDSISFKVGGSAVKICYGRPSARGRTMLGGYNVPLGKVWRTGANEPTTIHTMGAIVVAGIRLEPGSYSIYTIPGESEWVLILNRSTEQWGDEGSYNDVKAQDVGRATVQSTRLDQPVEQLTLRAEPPVEARRIILEWEKTRVTIPVEPAK